MPQLRPDSIFQEWMFTPEEDIQSRILPALLVLRLNTMYAELVKESANELPPETMELDRAYLLSRAERAGKLAFITQLFLEHKEATELLQANPNPNVATSQNSELHNLETRAAAQVYNGNTSGF